MSNSTITKVPFGDSLEQTWNQLYQKQQFFTPFSSYEWYHNYQETVGNHIQPYILLYNNVLLAPFSRNQNVLTFHGDPELSDYMDLVGEETYATKAWKDILLHVASDGITTIVLNNVPQTSPTYEFFSQNPSSSFYTATTHTEDTTPIVHLPDSWDEYLSSLARKQRHELKRKLRKFERENEDARIETTSADEQKINDFMVLMELNRDKKNFFNEKRKQFFLGFSKHFSKSMYIRSLFVKNVYAAMTLSFVNETTVFLYNSGFNDKKFSGAGFYLKGKDISYAIENKHTQYNFLQGNERYKYELGGIDFNVYTIHISIKNL